MLLDRAAPGDNERGRELFAAGRAEVEQLGMTRELVRFERFQERLAAYAPPLLLSWSRKVGDGDYMKQTQTIVGVRELRARLSAYLRAVAEGRTIIIGDRRRRPVARLVPVARAADDEILDRLAARGVLQRAVGKPSAKPRVASRSRKRLVSDIVIEGRG
jgi:prevent-host-death family protein